MWSSNPKLISKKHPERGGGGGGVGLQAPNFENLLFIKSILGVGCVYSEELVSFGLVV